MPTLRTLFFHSSLPAEGLQVKNPTGWESAALKLERDDVFKTLIESFESTQTVWYGNAAQQIQTVLQQFGVNAELRVRFLVALEINNYETLFDGLIQLSETEIHTFGGRVNKVVAPVIRGNFWSRLMNRYDMPVSLASNIDLSGGFRALVPSSRLNFRGQELREENRHIQQLIRSYADSFLSTGTVVDVGFNTEILREFDGKRSFSDQINPPSTPGKIIYTLPERGRYDVNIQIRVRLLRQIDQFGNFTLHPFQNVTFFIQFNDETPFPFSNHASDNFTDHRINTSFHNRNAGDIIRLWGTIDNMAWNTGDAERFEILGRAGLLEDGDPQTFFYISSNSTFDDTQNDCFTIFNAAESILSKVTERDNVLISSKFSGPYGRHALMAGYHVRGFTFAEKPLSMTLKEFFESANAMFNLCLGYTSDDKIFIEDAAFAYNEVPVVNLPNVENFVLRRENDKLIKTVDVGFSEWSVESTSGLDDPQANQVRNTALKAVGEKKEILSGFFAASLGIEQARRNRNKSADSRIDEKILIISTLEAGATMTNEFHEHFDVVINVHNSARRINLRHTPNRILRRWLNVVSAGFTDLWAGFFLTKSQGNVSLITMLSASDYESVASQQHRGQIVETMPVPFAGSLFLPLAYEITDYKMSWQTYKSIVANRNSAVGVSLTDANFVPMFIDRLTYDIFSQKATILLRPINSLL